MAAAALPDRDHVVRYVGLAGVRDGKVDGTQFCLRPGEDGLSVNWLECFDHPTNEQQIAAVRRVIHRSLGRQAVFAGLNVGDLRRHLRAELPDIRCVSTPQPPNDRFPNPDPSHSDIIGLPPPAAANHALIIGDMIARRVKTLYPATLPEE